MSLSVPQPAPNFSTTDIFGTPIELQKLLDKKVYLAFERNAGCPVCNLHMHTLLKKAGQFTKNNIEVLLVYESSVEKMKEYLGENSYPFHFIADPDNRLYQLYDVQQSTGKFFKSLFNGLIGKASEGKKLYKKPIGQDGHMTTIPGEFIINESGKLTTVHYGNFIGDHLPVQAILTNKN